MDIDKEQAIRALAAQLDKGTPLSDLALHLQMAGWRLRDAIAILRGATEKTTPEVEELLIGSGLWKEELAASDDLRDQLVNSFEELGGVDSEQFHAERPEYGEAQEGDGMGWSAGH